MTSRIFLPITLILPALAACGGGAPPPVQEQDLVSILKSRPSLTRFTEALETTGIANTLAAGGTYTIFAPIDKAVTGPLDQATLRHHILPQRVTFSDMAGESTSYDTLNADQIEIDVTDQIIIGSGLMVESDIEAANGIIHVIDSVQTATPGPEPLIDQPVPQPAPQPLTNTTAPTATTN